LVGVAIVAQAQEYGLGIYYNDKYHGKKTASGELYDKNKMTAAHRTHPFGTKLRVKRLDTDQEVIVTVNDRGPFNKGYVIDVSRVAAEKLDLIQAGSARVAVTVVTDEVEEAPVVADAKPPVAPKVPDELIGKGADVPKAPAAPAARNFAQGQAYTFQISQLPQEGFAVQVASMSDLKIAMDKVAELQAQWFSQVSLHVGTTAAGKDIYRVLLGHFAERSAASQYKLQLEKEKEIKGFVVEIARLGIQ
jgi:rare lipoprotein A